MHADLGGTLAGRQAELVAALVAGAPDPAGFDRDRLAAARRALVRKRAGEAAKQWPLLAAIAGAAVDDSVAAQPRVASRPVLCGTAGGWPETCARG